MSNFLLKRFPVNVFAFFISLLSVTYNSYGQNCNSDCSRVVNSGTNGTVTGNAGELICIQGNANNNLNINGSGVIVCIAPNVTFSQSNINFNGSGSVIFNNYGTLTLSNADINPNWTINNYGTVNGSINKVIGGTINNRGTWSSTLNNFSGGTFNNYSNFTIGLTIGGGTFTNQSGAIFNSSLTLNSSNSKFINSGSATISGSLNINSTTSLTSAGTLNITGSLTINGGGALSITGAPLTIGGAVSNNGTINATNAIVTINGGLGNNGGSSIILNNSQVNVSGSLGNDGTIRNSGSSCVSIKVTGTSNQNSNGVFGTAGPAGTTPKTDLCTNGTSGFNNNTGTLNNATTCSCSVNPLPVTFINFTGSVQSSSVVLKWQTADEKNNKEFVIEHSSDGKTFEKLAIVAGNGTTNQVSAYQFVDASPSAGNNYYRIRQVDFDQTESYYSKIVVVKTDAGTAQVVIAPNPTSGQNVSIKLSEVPTHLKVTVMDIKGTSRVSQHYAQPQLENELSVQGLERGVYVIVVQSHKQTETLRLVKL